MEQDYAWIDEWVSLLEEVGRRRDAHYEALALIDDLLADPFVQVGPATMRLSEWEDFWWEHVAPLVLALGINPLEAARPWARIASQVAGERSKQSLRVLPEPGLDL